MFTVVDGLLSLALVSAAAAIFWLRDLRLSAGGLVLFGLLMSLVWGRLEARMLVFAEALLGALMTGLLFWYALSCLKLPPVPSAAQAPGIKYALVFPAALAGAGLVGLLFVATGALRMTPLFGGIYALIGMLLVGIGFFRLAFESHLLRKVLAFNVLGSGVFLLMVNVARNSGTASDEALHASHFLVLVGLLVAVAAGLLTIVLVRMRLALGADPADDGLKLDAG